MKRLIQQKLAQWVTQPRRKPLIIRGARQIGKTWSVMHLGATSFNGQVHRMDLEKHPEWHAIFEGNLDTQRILAEIEIAVGSRITPGKDLLFFDEIQSCPRAIMALRYFYEEMPELHVIAAGSLLEFALQDIAFPVGRIQFLEMFPLSFKEFLLAMEQPTLVELLDQKPQKLSAFVTHTMHDHLRNYLFVGGMPEAVSVFAQTQSFEATFQVQNDLIDTFRQDFAKYAPLSDKNCIRSVFTHVAKQVGNITKYTHLATGFSNPTIHKAYDLLRTARLITKVCATSPAGIPLSAHASEKKFKTLLLDVGLMRAAAGITAKDILAKTPLLGIYEGALAEQFVGQELLATHNQAPYFWSRDEKSSQAEVDYLVTKDETIVPIKVKSSSAGRLKSLHLLLKTYPNCPKGYILSDQPYSELPAQNLIFIPLCYAGSL